LHRFRRGVVIVDGLATSRADPKHILARTTRPEFPGGVRGPALLSRNSRRQLGLLRRERGRPPRWSGRGTTLAIASSSTSGDASLQRAPQ
jgi:hypothetical protein